MTKAKDIMTKNVVCVKEDTPIYEALELLVQHNISGITVVEDDMILVAIISERDVLGLYHSSEDMEGGTVGDYMTQPAVFFEAEESLSDICECLARDYFRRVPVTSKGKLVGVVSRRDIIKSILQTRHQSAVVG